MTETPAQRIGRALGVEDVVERLATRISPTDLQSLLLEVARLRAARLEPADVLRRYEESRFTRPTDLDPRLLLELDRLAFDAAAPPFEPLELAPVAPLGSVSVLAGLDQNLAVATVRTGEVVSDSTNVLALECAVRRRSDRHATVRLCATHRLLRGQRYSNADARAHFRLFGLCTAGRDSGSWRFELESLAEHLLVYVRLFARLPEVGLVAPRVRLAVTRLAGAPPREVFERQLFARVVGEFPDTRVAFDEERTSGRGYYEGACFALHVEGRPLVDGGFVDWTQRLLADRKERLLVSGVGTELLATLLAP